ncbi:27788_t:CDS:2, partial [Gigaspora margarita]
MIIERLFQKYRKIEPTSLFVLRNFVLILLLIALLEYTWLIIWGIYNDNPIIQNSLEEGSYIPVPGLFSTDDLMFSAVPNNGISSLEFKLYLNDTSYNISDSIFKPIIVASLVEAGSNDLLTVDDLFQQDPFQNLPLTYSKFPITALLLNQYQLAVNSSFKVKINRRRKELMVPSWKNYLGISSKRESVPYLTSTLGTIPIKPWGLIQKYGFKINKSVQEKLKDTLGFIPLVQRPKTNNLNNYVLKRRLDSLQQFLTEYVVDVQYLEEIYKANINNK